MSHPLKEKLIWSTVTGAVAGLAAFIISALFLNGNTSGWQTFIYSATLGTFLTGFGLWWLAMSWRPKMTIFLGSWIGVLIGILAHPVAWYIEILRAYLMGETTSLGERTANPIEGLAVALGFSLFSLLILGWITLPIGGFGGGFIALFQGNWRLKQQHKK